jgi:hypothetical protein
MNSFSTGWPFLGLGLAFLLLILLFCTRWIHDPKLGRFSDPIWFAWLALPVYMIHQFEEHGIDFHGRHYAFREEMCSALGYAGADCPLPELFFTVVNVGTVWGAALLGALLGRKYPYVALSAFGIPLVNAVAHILPAAAKHQYNPGLVTGIVLFIPVSIRALRLAMRSGDCGRLAVVSLVMGGILIHAVLMASAVAFTRGMINEPVLIAAQLVNIFVPALCAFGFQRWDLRTS